MSFTSASRAAAWDEPGTNQPRSFVLLLKHRQPCRNPNLSSLTPRNFSTRKPNVTLILHCWLWPLPDASEECKRKAASTFPVMSPDHAGRENYSSWQVSYSFPEPGNRLSSSCHQRRSTGHRIIPACLKSSTGFSFQSPALK